MRRRGLSVRSALVLLALSLAITLGPLLLLRYGISPCIDAFRPLLQTFLEKKLQTRLQAQQLSLRWRGLNPTLQVDGLQLISRNGTSFLSVRRFEIALSYRSITREGIKAARLLIDSPSFSLERKGDREFHLTGFGATRAAAGSPIEALTRWFSEQPQVVVRRAQIQLIDNRNPAHRLNWRLPPVEAEWRNRGNRHRFWVLVPGRSVPKAAAPRAALLAGLMLKGDFIGPARRPTEWRGGALLRVEEGTLTPWLRWLPSASLPPGVIPSNAEGDARVVFTVHQGRLKNATVDFALHSLHFQLAPDVKPINDLGLSGKLSFSRSSTALLIQGSAIRLMPADAPEWRPVYLTGCIRHGIAQVAQPLGRRLPPMEVSVDGLEAAAILRLLPSFEVEPSLRRTLLVLAPAGVLRTVKVRFNASNAEPWYFQAQLERIATQAYRQLPALSNVSGQLRVSPQRGAIELNGMQAQLSVSALWKRPLERVSWGVNASWLTEGQRVEVSQAHLHSKDVQLKFSGRYENAKKRGAWVEGRADIVHLEGQRIPPLLAPLNAPVLNPWLRSALEEGQLINATLRVNGKVDDIPFSTGKGLFQLEGQVRNVTLRFSPNWPALTTLDATLLLKNDQLRMTSQRGKIFGASLGPTTALLSTTPAGRQLHVSGRVQTATSRFLHFIDHSPVRTLFGTALHGVRAHGNGDLHLKLVIPFDPQQKARFDGSLTVNNNQFLSPSLPPITQANATLRFNERTISLSDGQANFLDFPTYFQAKVGADRAVQLSAAGHVAVAGLRARGTAIPAEITGKTDWQATLQATPSAVRWSLNSSLKGLASTLGAPLLKAADTVERLSIQREMKRATRSGTLGGLASAASPDPLTPPVADDNKFLWNVQLGDPEAPRLSAIIEGQQRSGRDTVQRALLQFGPSHANAADLPAAGVHVQGTIPTLAPQAWLHLLPTEGLNGGLQRGSLLPLSLSLQVETLLLAGHRWNSLQITGQSEGTGWKGQLQGEEIAGHFRWTPGQLTADIQRLRLSPSASLAVDAASAFSDVEPHPSEIPRLTQRPIKWPALDLRIESLEYGPRALGTLRLNAKPDPNGWQLQKLTLMAPEGGLVFDGYWKTTGLTASNTIAEVNVQLDAKDAGKLLERLGWPGLLRRGQCKIEGYLTWQGRTLAAALSTLTGQLALQAKEGQLSQLDPGIGRLLGALSLESLPRRLLFDFRDVFSDGLAFNTMSGLFDLQGGLISTDQLRLSSAVVDIVLSGNIDLIKKTQKLNIHVVPLVSNALSAGFAIANPLIGAIAFGLQKLLGEPMEGLVSSDYQVTGKWGQPTVVKVKRF